MNFTAIRRIDSLDYQLAFLQLTKNYSSIEGLVQAHLPLVESVRRNEYSLPVVLKKDSKLTLVIDTHAFYLIYGEKVTIGDRSKRSALRVPFSGEKPSRVECIRAVTLSQAEFSFRNRLANRFMPHNGVPARVVDAYCFGKKKFAFWQTFDTRPFFYECQHLLHLFSDDEIEEELFRAVKDNDADSILFLRAASWRLQRSTIALNLAAALGRLEAMRALLSYGYTKAQELKKAVVYASMQGHATLVWELLRAVPDGFTNLEFAFIAAVNGGQIATLDTFSHVKALLEPHTEIALQAAAAYNQINSIVWLTLNGFKTVKGIQLAFLQALQHNHVSCARVIFNSYIESDEAKAETFVTACNRTFEPTVQLVHIFTGNISQPYLKKALEEAVCGIDALHVVAYLLPFLKDVQTQGEKALLLASEKGVGITGEQVVLQLIHAGVNANIIDRNGMTPILYCSQKGWNTAVDLILKSSQLVVV